LPPENQNKLISDSLSVDKLVILQTLEVRHGGQSIQVNRPIYPFEPNAVPVPSDMFVAVDINEKGLRATGFLAGYESIIFPAEFRGISIRVRGVAIGESGFLGAEHLLTGANRAALSQITGEINVLAGLDAVDTLNPGRESFYEESQHYKVLRTHLLGEGERVTGYLGKAITAVLRRSQVQSSLSDLLGRAGLRRRALEDVSAAVTHLIAQGDAGSDALQKMLRATWSHANGLPTTKDHELDLPPRIGGLSVVRTKSLPQPANIDYASERVQLDMTRPEWDWSLLLFDRRFEVVHKRGGPDHPVAEVDFKLRRIFINWGHPVKLQMDERGFIRTALAWVLAKEAACKDPEQMMQLALKLLSFTAHSDG
jgi:hypothetical protein